MGKYHIRMSEEYITATLEAVMQKHDPAAAAITNEQERMIQEWGSDVIVLLSNQLSEAIAEVEALRAERDELRGWLKDKRFATENAWRAYRITQDYCNGAMSAFGEVLERLSE